MSKELFINVDNFETRIALVENGNMSELYIERNKNKSLVGNIYKGKIINVLPGLQSAFIDIGRTKAAFCISLIFPLLRGILLQLVQKMLQKIWMKK